MQISSEARPPDERSRVQRRTDHGVAANARLTTTNAAVLPMLLAAEDATILPPSGHVGH